MSYSFDIAANSSKNITLDMYSNYILFSNRAIARIIYFILPNNNGTSKGSIFSISESQITITFENNRNIIIENSYNDKIEIKLFRIY